jgi:predicted phage baseplate assembly protein
VLRFGDGLTGHVPALDPADGAAAVSVAFTVGAGPRGNLGSALEWRTDASDDITATSAVAAEGGADPESPAAARDRVAAGFRRAERAVLREDFEALAMSTAGVAVARARAAIGRHPRFPCTPVPGAVSVFVVPRVPRGGDDDVRAPVPDPGALAAVAARLERARLIGTQVFARAPRYRAVRLAVTVSSARTGDPSAQPRLEAEFRRFLDPLVGGDEQLGWPWGEPLRPSALLRRAAAVLEDVAAVAIGLDGAAPDEACQDVPIGADDLVVLEELSVRWSPLPAAEGGLR